MMMLRSRILNAIKSKSILRYESTSKLNIESLEKDIVSADVIEDELQLRENAIELKRNKSRLRESDRNFLNEKNPYPEPEYWYHGTLKYNRRLYGRYGLASGVNPTICWPTKKELQDTLEYEKVAYPFTIPEMIESAKRKRSEKEEEILERQQDIVKKMEKLETWKQEFRDKIAKKQSEVIAAKQRREKLIEEVRRHFGYTVDPKDDRFKEMLEKKEKEQKKAMKEERRKIKEEKMMAKLLSKKADNAKEKQENTEDKEDDISVKKHET